jgi:hypothetical protein
MHPLVSLVAILGRGHWAVRNHRRCSWSRDRVDVSRVRGDMAANGG